MSKLKNKITMFGSFCEKRLWPSHMGRQLEIGIEYLKSSRAQFFLYFYLILIKNITPKCNKIISQNKSGCLQDFLLSENEISCKYFIVLARKFCLEIFEKLWNCQNVQNNSILRYSENQAKLRTLLFKIRLNKWNMKNVMFLSSVLKVS